MIDIFSGTQSTSAALLAERTRMEAVSQNIANAYTTRGPDGRPYQRQQVIFETVLAEQTATPGVGGTAIPVARVQADERPPRLVHIPGHPDANAEGMVAMPDIDTHREMVDLLMASRAFEANLAVVKTSRSLAMQTLSIGKRG
jgi:flagellar basal-body rod protein FlgC